MCDCLNSRWYFSLNERGMYLILFWEENHMTMQCFILIMENSKWLIAVSAEFKVFNVELLTLTYILFS